MRTSITAGLACATAFALALLLTPLIRAIAVRYGWIARTAEDRWGRRIVARLGGVAMFASFLIAVLLWVPLEPTMRGLLTGLVLVFGLGLVDDFHRIPPYTKLVCQLLIGSVMVLTGIRLTLIQWEWVAIPFSILWFVLVMNAFNLLDNMDGLAGGVGAIAAGFCALHAGMNGQWTIAALAAAVAGASAGFLRYNFPPAKIFMGDSGSHFLGLSLAALALMGSWRHSTQLLSVLFIPTLVLAVPIFDTCFVTIQRLTHGQHPFQGGTDHVSHRLAILGLSTRQTVMVFYAVSICFGLLSLMSVQMAVLSSVIVCLVVLAGLLMFGLYLARVEVYRLPRATPSELSRPATIIETMLLHKRRLVEILVDFALICSAYVVAHLLRFEGTLTGDTTRLIVHALPIMLFVQLGCFMGCGLYRGVWKYLGLSDLIMVFRAVTLGSLLSSAALLYLWRFEGYSRAVLIIDWLLLLFAIGGSRVVERLLDEWINAAGVPGVPTLIIGAGDTAERVLRHLVHEDRMPRRIIGLLDDDARMHGSRIHGHAVLGGWDRLLSLLEEGEIREVLVAIDDPPGELLEYIRKHCEPKSVAWRVVTAGVISAHE